MLHNTPQCNNFNAAPDGIVLIPFNGTKSTPEVTYSDWLELENTIRRQNEEMKRLKENVEELNLENAQLRYPQKVLEMKAEMSMEWKKALESRNEQLKRALEIIESTKEESERSEKIREKIDEIIQRYSSLESEIKKLKGINEGLKEQIQEQKEGSKEKVKMEEMQRLIGELKMKNSEQVFKNTIEEEKWRSQNMELMKSKNEEISKMKKDYQSKIETMIEEHSKRINEDGIAINHLNSIIAENEATEIGMSEENEKLREQIQNLKQIRLNEQDRRCVEKREVVQLEKELEYCRQKAGEWKARGDQIAAEKNHEIQQYQKRNAELHQEIQNLKREKEETRETEHQNAEKRVQILEKNLKNALKKNTSFEAEIERWRRRNTELVKAKNEEMEELKLEFKSAFDAKINTLKATISDKEAAEMKMKQEIKMLSEKIQKSQQNDTSEQRQIVEKNKIIQELTNKLAVVRNAIGLSSTSSG